MKSVVDELNLVVYGDGTRPQATPAPIATAKHEESHDDEDNFFDTKTFKKAA